MPSARVLAPLLGRTLAAPRVISSVLQDGTDCLSRPVLRFNHTSAMKVASSQKGGSDQTGAGELEKLWDRIPGDLMSPMRSFSRMIEDMNCSFQMFRFPSSPHTTDRFVLRKPFQVQEDSSAYYLRIDIPGFSKDEVKIQIKGTLLGIKGVQSKEKSADARFYDTFGYFEANITLFEHTDAKIVAADFKDGVVHITLPKLPQANPNHVVGVPMK